MTLSILLVSHGKSEKLLLFLKYLEKYVPILRKLKDPLCSLLNSNQVSLLKNSFWTYNDKDITFASLHISHEKPGKTATVFHKSV